jgi:hypothetical protein
MDQNKYHVPKRETNITIHFLKDRNVEGEIFASNHDPKHLGPQNIMDVLDEHDKFIPVNATDSGLLTLINKNNITYISVKRDFEFKNREYGQETHNRRRIKIYFSDNETLTGDIFIDRFEDSVRDLDFLNKEDDFFHMVMGDDVFVVNKKLIAKAVGMS